MEIHKNQQGEMVEDQTANKTANPLKKGKKIINNNNH
jgi:hypothetical protein